MSAGQLSVHGAFVAEQQLEQAVSGVWGLVQCLINDRRVAAGATPPDTHFTLKGFPVGRFLDMKISRSQRNPLINRQL